MEGTEALRNILDLERRKGYTDRAVIGGLDRYLHRHAAQLRELTKDAQLLGEFDELNLADFCYGSLSPEERGRWLADVTGWLDRLERPGKEAVGSRRARDKAQPSASGKKKAPTRATAGRRENREAALNEPITIIKGITPSVAGRFAKLNVRVVHDLLRFFPRRYVDYSQTRPICELVEGEEQTVIGTIWQARVATLGSRQGTEAIVGDETGNVRAVWFNQPYLAKSFRTNARIVLAGSVGLFRGNKVFEVSGMGVAQGHGTHSHRPSGSHLPADAGAVSAAGEEMDQAGGG